ncbi:MAG: glycosyltransferase family 4 protein [Acidobacteria bacterium]|nr:glycosyltransferase family 4 protein [Acidobacteriota bacterium]
MSSLRILIATDAFPPVCGGSGWSTYELASGLRARGHTLTIVQPKTARDDEESAEYDGFRVMPFRAPAPDVPYVRNVVKNEWLYRRLGSFLRDIIVRVQIDLVHAQHVLTGPASVRAARSAGVPVVCTVRDYWPVCYWSDLIHDPSASSLCPACSTGMMARCIRPRAGALWPLALPMIPYMRGNLGRKRQALVGADAVIAVSSTLAADLRRRAPELARTRVEVIPNPVDVRSIRAVSAGGTPDVAAPYAVYVGKLAANKGAGFLVSAIRKAGLKWPVVVVGEGPERAMIERQAADSGLDVRFTGWLPRDRTLVWLAGASLLIFPSYGPESLSRTLLEAGALGIAIAAMDTGGTRDIITHDETGLLSATPDELAHHIRRLVADPGLRERLGGNARRRVEDRFDAPAVVARIETLYRDLLRERPVASAAVDYAARR